MTYPLPLAALILGVLGLSFLVYERRRAQAAVGRLSQDLAAESARAEVIFDPASLAELPAPAARFLGHALAAGTRLPTAVELRMEGTIRLRPGAPARPMEARQLLSTGGLVWRARVGAWPLRMVGFDVYAGGVGALRWWLSGVLPVVNAGGADISRSAAGRLALEWVAWLPSALVSAAVQTRWRSIDDGQVGLTVVVDGEPVEMELTVDDSGRLTRLQARRWDPQGADGKPGYRTWVADRLGGERTFGGLTVPTEMHGVARAGSSEELDFFEATLTSAEPR